MENGIKWDSLYIKLYMETNFRWITFCENQNLKHIEKKDYLM